jgi:hypothetical protein
MTSSQGVILRLQAQLATAREELAAAEVRAAADLRRVTLSSDNAVAAAEARATAETRRATLAADNAAYELHRLRSTLGDLTAERNTLASTAQAQDRTICDLKSRCSALQDELAVAVKGSQQREANAATHTSSAILTHALVQQLKCTSDCVDQLATTVMGERVAAARDTAVLQDELKGGDILARVLTHQNKVLAGCTDTATSTIEVLRTTVTEQATALTQVITTFGPGRVVRRRADGMYEVALSYGTAVISEACIVGTPAYEEARNSEVKTLRKQLAASQDAEAFQVRTCADLRMPCCSCPPPPNFMYTLAPHRRCRPAPSSSHLGCWCGRVHGLFPLCRPRCSLQRCRPARAS